MSDESFNLYDEEENIITDDSSGVEENDDLMNEAVSSLRVEKVEHIKPSTLGPKVIMPSTNHQKRRFKSLGLRLKRKYISWLNKRRQQERILKYFIPGHGRRKYKQENHRLSALNDLMGADVNSLEYSVKENSNTVKSSNIPAETIDLDDTDIEDEENIENEHHRKDNELGHYENDHDDIDDEEDEDDDMDEEETGKEEEQFVKDQFLKENDFQTTQHQNLLKQQYGNMTENMVRESAIKTVESQNGMQNKYAAPNDDVITANAIEPVEAQPKIQEKYHDLTDAVRPSTPNSIKTTSELNTPLVSKDITTVDSIDEIKQDSGQNIFFSDELNQMYPQFDEIIGKHVHSLKTTESIEKKISLITMEVQAINHKLQIKENEYNKLLYDKKIKEEILIRMLRKLKLLDMKKVPMEGKEYDLMALKELEDAIAKTSPRPPVNRKQLKEMTAKELIEKRAKMTKEDLEIERAAWGPVQSLLKDLYPEEQGSIRNASKLLPKVLSRQNSIINQYLKGDTNISTPQELRSAAQYTDDFMKDDLEDKSQSTNHRLLNRMMFQSEDLSTSQNLMETEVLPYSSTLEKLLSRSSPPLEKSFGHRNDTAMLIHESREVQEDISVVPVFKETEYIPQTASKREKLVVRLESSSVMLCQHCRTHEARFLCAACQNQWYCSRSCQVTAWKNHCETCE